MRPSSTGDGDVEKRVDEVVEALVALGVARRAAEDAVRGGDPEGAVFASVLLPGRLDRTVSPARIEAEGGLTAEEVAEMMLAFGLPPGAADEAAFTPREASVFVELRRLSEIWTREVRLQVARVYGRMLGRIASAEVQAFRQQTEPHVRGGAPDTAAGLRALRAAAEELLRLADPLLIGVHRRWVEHELGQVAVGDAERRAGVAPLPGSVEVTFLFCDLKDFTAYAAAEGDAAAIAAIDRFFEAVTRECGDQGQIVKTLGDGAMLVYDDPVQAVATGARVIAAMRAGSLPGVHASVHQGVAIAREGDYFGSSVNLAARMLGLGGRDELVVSAPVVEACADVCRWESIGEWVVRGVERPLAVYRMVPGSLVRPSGGKS